MQTNIKISLDFDKTLDQLEVQEFAKELIAEGIDVHIVTYRYSDENTSPEQAEWLKMMYPDPEIYEYNGSPTYNGDLFRVADSAGIPRENIHFTNYEDKDKFFTENPDFLWHLDDSEEQILAVGRHTTVIPVQYPNEGWKELCKTLIEDHE